ncbi:PP2C family protein-serine/threonine phosphatase [Thermococcus sp.]
MFFLLPQNPDEEFRHGGNETVYGVTHVGGREHNEDGLLIMELPDAYLLAVADGLGGHSAGEIASRLALETLSRFFMENYEPGMGLDALELFMKDAHKAAHSALMEKATGPFEGMGTTLVSAVVRGGNVIVANTGDSRAYLFEGSELVERTMDHSPLQELVLSGEVSEEEAMWHPLRNRVSAAIGRKFKVDVYWWKLGDILLLSTDGLHDYVPKAGIIEVVSSGQSAKEITFALVERALPVTRDNVTIVVWKKNEKSGLDS